MSLKLGIIYGLVIGLRAAIMAQGLYLPEDQYLGHTTTSNHNLFINWLLGLTLSPGLNQAIMGFNRPLWDLLGNYRF